MLLLKHKILLRVKIQNSSHVCFWRHGPIQSLCGRMCCNHRRLYVDAAMTHWIDITAILNVALLNLSAVIRINYTASF